MSIYSNDGRHISSDHKLELFHETRGNPRAVKCIKDNPSMVGFGRKLSSGDIIEIDGTVFNEIGFCVAVPNECAFYEYDAFIPSDDFFNV